MSNQREDAPINFNVLKEQAQVHREVVEHAKVRIIKKVHEEEASIDVSARSEAVNVKRVPVDQYVDAAPAIRYEGNTTIIPVVQEVVVLQKRLLLVEEVHITREVNLSEEERSVPLRREEVVVERVTTQ